MYPDSQPLPISATMPDVASPSLDEALRGRFAKRSLRESPAAPAQPNAAPDFLEHQQHIQTRELINRPRAIYYQQRRLF